MSDQQAALFPTQIRPGTGVPDPANAEPTASGPCVPLTPGGRHVLVLKDTTPAVVPVLVRFDSTAETDTIVTFAPEPGTPAPLVVNVPAGGSAWAYLNSMQWERAFTADGTAAGTAVAFQLGR